MVFHSIDREECSGCGLCAKVCALGILTQEAENKVPSAIHADKCMLCGHCVAICPDNAIAHTEMNMSNFRTLENPHVDALQIEYLLKSKRSMRHYKEKPLDREIIERLIEVARQAPSTHNYQEREFIVVTDQDKIKHLEKITVGYWNRVLALLNPLLRKILLPAIMPGSVPMIEREAFYLQDLVNRANDKGKSVIFYDAPYLIFIHGPKANPLSKDNCLASQHYLMLYAHALGLGTCIIGYATAAAKVIGKDLGIPKEHKIYSAITIGYPKYQIKKTVDRKEKGITWI